MPTKTSLFIFIKITQWKPLKIQICKNQKSTLQLNHYTSSAGYVGSNDGGITRKEMQFVLSC